PSVVFSASVSSFIPLVFLFSLSAPATTGIYTFPYTTLFRSGIYSLASSGASQEPSSSPHKVTEIFRSRSTSHRPSTRVVNVADGDRKSTRLNSSHVKISYAVFCLKKKKQKQTNTKRL